MKQITVTSLLAVLMAGIVFLSNNACTKPSPFGASQLDDERGDFAFTDTLTIQCTVLPEDSLVTSDRNSTTSYMLCGKLNDPVFGRSESEIYTLFRLRDLNPNFKTAQVDSIVLFLRYAVAGFYGDTLQPHTVRVHRLADGERIRWNQDYYSNQSFPVAELLGEVTDLFPRPTLSVPLFDTTTLGPHLRIPLDNAFGQEILSMDSLSLTSDTAFWEKIRGIRITAESASNPGAIMAFNLNDNTFSRVRLYYKFDQDTIQTSRTFDFFFLGGNKFTHFAHDYTGTRAAAAIGTPATDLLFAQGMGGLRIKMEIPYAHLLENIAVNKAELELTAATLPESDPALPVINQLVFTEILGDTATTLTSDVIASLGSTLTGGFDRFGGFPKKAVENSTVVDRYRLTLTRRFQAMVDNTSGDLKDQTVYINVYPQVRSAHRAAFYGPQSATFPAKLTLKYTRVR